MQQYTMQETNSNPQTSKSMLHVTIIHLEMILPGMNDWKHNHITKHIQYQIVLEEYTVYTDSTKDRLIILSICQSSVSVLIVRFGYENR